MSGITPKKIAIVGSCLVRDNFNTNFNPGYKHFFECILHQHQCSFLSLMSPELPFMENEETKKMNAFTKWHYRTEHTKEFFKLLQSNQPEYLLIDTYADLYLGVVRLDNGFFTYNPKFKNVSPVKGEAVWTIEADFDSYFDTWVQHLDAFFQFMQDKVPSCGIILVKAQFEDLFTDGSSLNEWRKKRKYPVVDIERLNCIWNKMNDYIETHFNVQILDMTQKKYRLEKEHPWGNFYVHFTKDFYHDFLQQLGELIGDNSIERGLE
ncbi:DUF6270 domain-containing protein [Listeria aquatica]|uniref:DUF6270 domain-containing protein n=1 Tax=Listeria aquatica TaxID=1494960 RepID=UPI003EF8D77C